MKSFNIQTAVENALSVVKVTNETFGKNYLSKILKGVRNFVRTEHQELPEFGQLSNWKLNKIEILFDYLKEHEYLNLKDEFKGIYQISEKGNFYLQKKTKFTVYENALRPKQRYYYFALSALKAERNKQALELDVPSYELCTNYQLERIITWDITNVESLQNFSIFRDWQGRVQWDLMIGAYLTAKKEYYSPKRLKGNQTYLKIQELIDQKKPLAEIIRITNLKESTVIQYIESMFLNEKMNIKDWIMQNVEKIHLVKSIEFFTKNKEAKLREAHEAINVGYNHLKLCRLYFQIHQEMKEAA